MERKPRTKRQLLDDMAMAVAGWPGKAKLNKRLEWGIAGSLRLLEMCPVSSIERFRLEGCRACFGMALEGRPQVYVREIWLVEIWSWQHLIDVRAGLDSWPTPVPEMPPGRYRPPERFVYPLPRPLF